MTKGEGGQGAAEITAARGAGELSQSRDGKKGYKRRSGRRCRKDVVTEPAAAVLTAPSQPRSAA